MTRRRSRFQIYLEVLRIIKNGTKKPTQIMYAAGISWRTLVEILKSLISQGLVNEYSPSELIQWKRSQRDRRTKKNYEITPKGENVIQYFHATKKTLDLEELIEVFT